MPPAIITPLLVGAAVGAVSAAVQGGNILKGALMGAVTGGIGAAFSGVLGGAASGALSGAEVAAASDAAVASGGAAAEIAAPAATVADTAGSNFGGAIHGPETAATGPATTTGTGISADMGGGSGLSTGGAGNTGIAATPADTGLGATRAGTGIMAPTTPQAQQGGVLDQIFSKGKDFLGSRAGMDMTGRVLTGVGQGIMAAKTADAKVEAEERARQNARYGNVASRYNTTGGIFTASYKA